MIRQKIQEEMQRRHRADALKKATLEVEQRMMPSPAPPQDFEDSTYAEKNETTERMVDLLHRDSPPEETDEKANKDTNKKSEEVIFPSLLSKDAEKRFLQAYTRIETAERSLDRKLLSAKNKVAEQDFMIHILIKRIEELEEKLYLTRIGLVYKPKSKPKTKYSPLVADRATQTKSENHNAEGVYVTVARSNHIKLKSRKAVSRMSTYAQPDRKLDEEKVIYLPHRLQGTGRNVHTADSFNNTL